MDYITKGNLVLNLKLQNLETYNVGTVRVTFSLKSDVTRDGVFGQTGNLLLNMSYDQSDLRYNKYKTKNSSYSPRLVTGAITTTIGEQSRILSSEVKLADWFESSVIEESYASGGIITPNIIPEQSESVLLKDYATGNNRLRPLKVFFKNISDRDLSFVHVGIDYPKLAIDDLNLVNIGTDTDTYTEAEGYSGWVYSGILKTDIPQGDRLVDYVITVDFGATTSSLLWVGQLLRLYNGKATMYVAISEITGVTDSIVQLKVFSENDVLFDFDKEITIVSGVKSITNVQKNEIIPIWLLNIIPSGSDNIQKRIRVWAQGIR